MVLNYHLYNEVKDKSRIIMVVRFWKSLTNKLEEILEIDKKFKNSSVVKINATLLNFNEEDKKRHIDDANIADEDIIIAET